jgi:hypothetical protein
MQFTTVPNVDIVHGPHITKNAVPKPKLIITTCFDNYSGDLLLPLILAVVLCWTLPPTKMCTIYRGCHAMNSMSIIVHVFYLSCISTRHISEVFITNFIRS